MDKILTISIAAYNVEAYIRNALESLCIPEIINELEVFIVDDGGRDTTLNIAKQYEKKYPGVFYAVHKDNGGYGSTVNYSIKHATGKYFKLLDGDDWYNSDGLRALVETMRNSDADIIICNYFTGPEEGNMRLIDLYRNEGEGIKKLANFTPNRYFGMWPMAIKTETIRQSNLKLPEHELYTDQYFCTYPLGFARTIQYINYGVYCYRTERNGQSTSKESRIKHYKEFLNHAEKLTEFCQAHKGTPNYPIIKKRVGGYHSGAINTLLLKPICHDSLTEIKDYERRIKNISEDVYYEAQKAGETGRFLWLMRHTKYVAYWLLKLKK